MEHDIYNMPNEYKDTSYNNFAPNSQDLYNYVLNLILMLVPMQLTESAENNIMMRSKQAQV